AIVLAMVALWPPTSGTRLAYGLGMLLAFDVSLGFNGVSYRLFYDYFLPFRALRIPARMGIMVGFSLAVLAGFGAARVESWIRSATARRVTMIAVGMVMLVEYASKPLDLRQIPLALPEVYADLVRDRGDSPTAPIFEYPASPFDDPTYMYYSTFHWQLLLNGYSGFFPPSYGRLQGSLQGFPDDESMRALEARGARYVVIHGERLFGDRYETLIPRLDRRRELSLVSRRPWQHSEVSLYRVVYGS
ncbi:MAG TPA: hypothetical protein VNZ26_32465, partial [Vicinamibacterales bacterium]|nr:hypothetical protein [Vicinamibacterales bacterium]